MRSKIVSALLLGLAALAGLAGCGTSDGGPGEPLRLAVRSLPPAYIGERYEAKLPASGGVRPYSFELEGKLPKGLRFASGRISGVPQEKGSFKITVVVNDAALSSRSVPLTLKVSDPPPPKLTAKLPASETDAPFIAVFTLDKRPTQAFRLRLTLKDLKPDLESLKANPNLVYVVRYDEEQQALDIDGAFTQTFRGGEVFRLKLEPTRKLRPKVQPQDQFFKPDGEPYTNKPPKRPADEGAYAFDDLRALAQAWKRAPKKIEGQPPAPKENAPASPESPEGGPEAEPETPTAPPDGGSEDAAPPAGSEPRQPPQDQAGKKTTGFDPDLNYDGKVDAADLELLRQGYAFNPGGKVSPPPNAPGDGVNPPASDLGEPDAPTDGGGLPFDRPGS